MALYGDVEIEHCKLLLLLISKSHIDIAQDEDGSDGSGQSDDYVDDEEDDEDGDDEEDSETDDDGQGGEDDKAIFADEDDALPDLELLSQDFVNQNSEKINSFNGRLRRQILSTMDFIDLEMAKPLDTQHISQILPCPPPSKEQYHVLVRRYSIAPAEMWKTAERGKREMAKILQLHKANLLKMGINPALGKFVALHGSAVVGGHLFFEANSPIIPKEHSGRQLETWIQLNQIHTVYLSSIDSLPLSARLLQVIFLKLKSKDPCMPAFSLSFPSGISIKVRDYLMALSDDNWPHSHLKEASAPLVSILRHRLLGMLSRLFAMSSRLVAFKDRNSGQVDQSTVSVKEFSDLTIKKRTEDKKGHILVHCPYDDCDNVYAKVRSYI